MQLKQGVSIAALAAAALASGSAQAQTANVLPANVNVLNLLSPFLGLNSTAVGQQTLQLNLSNSIAINNNSTAAQRALAISDKALPGNTPFLGSITLANGTVVPLGPGDNLAGGLPLQAVQGAGTINPIQPIGGYGAVLGANYQTGIRASTATSGPLANTFNLLNAAYTFTSSDLGVAKNYFANGAATNPSTTPPGYVPVPAVAPAGYTLPRFGGLPNTTDSVYDLAYGVNNRQPGQDVYGSSRPVQVVPSRYNIFDPTALNGLATNPSFPSGHTNYGFTDSILLGMLTPQLYQSMLARGAEYGDSRIVLGVHYALDIIASRAFASYDLAQAFTNPLYINNATTTGGATTGVGQAINLPSLFVRAQGELSSYLSAQCGAAVATCATSAANNTGNPYVPSAANQTLYQQRLTYGLPTLTFAQAPREAAPAGGPDASILLATLYGGSTAAARQLAPNGGIYGSLQTGTINQIIQNTETNALAAFYGTALSYWSRIDLYSAAGYFSNVTGTLRLDPTDRVTTDVTVGNTGVLGGTGSVASLTVLSGGAVAPGSLTSPLTVTGNAVFAPGSTYQVGVNASGQSDRLAVGGAAAIAGGTLSVTPVAGAYDPRTRYTILTAAGGVTGQFATSVSTSANFAATARSLANQVDLTVTRTDIPFAVIAQNRNQAAVATAIQAGGPGTGVYDRTIGLSTPEAQGAFQGLSGDIHGSLISSEYETAFFVREAILDRMRWGATPGEAESLNYGSLPAAYTADLPGRRAPVAAVPVRVLDPRVFGMWAQGFGAFGDARTDRNAAGVNRQTSGFVAGADVRLETGFRLGIAGGYTSTTLDTAGRLQTGTVESGFGGVYGGYELGPVSLRLGAVYADNDARVRRTVIFAGAADALTSRPGGSTVQGFGELGYRFFLGGGAPAAIISKDGPRPAAALAYIEPFVGGSYVSISRDRFAERGGFAALNAAARDYDLGAFTAGVRGQTSLDLGLGAPVSAHGLIGYRRAFGDVVPTALLAFGNGPTFATAGLPIDRDAVVAEAGLDMKVAPNATLGVAYTGQVGNRAEDHAVKGNFTYRF